MLASSFRLVTARLIPGRFRYKQALLLGLLILAGCGGSRAPKVQAQWQTVSGDGWAARVPRGWSVVGGKTGLKASSGKDFVQVATFPLARLYTAALFTKVETELAARMDAVARQSGGTVSSHSVVSAGGQKAHEYDVKVDGKTVRYTFVLRRKREFLLVCSAGAGVCDELAASFSAG